MSSTAEVQHFDGTAVILVVGASGVGKTTFINRMAELPHATAGEGQPCPVASGVTRSMIKIKHDWHNVALIDTPGFNDANSSDAAVFKNLANWIAEDLTSKKVTAVLYLHSILGMRFSRSTKRNFEILSLLIGSEAMQNVLLVVTHWDLVNTGMLDTWVALARKNYFEQMCNLTACQTLQVFTVGLNDNDASHKVIARALEAQPIFLKIQEEMGGGVGLWETEAGVELIRELKCEIASGKTRNKRLRNALASGLVMEMALTESAYAESNQALEGFEAALGKTATNWRRKTRAFVSEHKKTIISGTTLLVGIFTVLFNSRALRD